MYGSSWDMGRFMKNFRSGTICNITQEPQRLQRYNYACGFIGKSAVIKYHHLLSKVLSINVKSSFDQLATASYPPYSFHYLSYFHFTVLYNKRGLALWKVNYYSTYTSISPIHSCAMESSLRQNIRDNLSTICLNVQVHSLFSATRLVTDCIYVVRTLSSASLRKNAVMYGKKCICHIWSILGFTWLSRFNEGSKNVWSVDSKRSISSFCRMDQSIILQHVVTSM